MKANLAFVTLSSILTIMPFRVNELHVSNVTSLSWTDEQLDYTFILAAVTANVWTHTHTGSITWLIFSQYMYISWMIVYIYTHGNAQIKSWKVKKWQKNKGERGGMALEYDKQHSNLHTIAHTVLAMSKLCHGCDKIALFLFIPCLTGPELVQWFRSGHC